MIKIGKCYFSESQIVAIQPSNDGRHADVYLVRGAVISVDVWEDDLPALLERAGLLSPGPAVEVLTFAPQECLDLKTAFADGYRFVAKDQTGQVYAYKQQPKKRGYEWTASEEAAARRLHGEFECLSFEDDEPLSLDALFSGGDAEGVDEQ